MYCAFNRVTPELMYSQLSFRNCVSSIIDQRRFLLFMCDFLHQADIKRQNSDKSQTNPKVSLADGGLPPAAL